MFQHNYGCFDSVNKISKMSTSSLTRDDSQEQAYWTDDLPVCMLSGVGVATNQIYKEDGSRREEHDCEDRTFHFKVEDICLYGVFDGHDGGKASHFAAQRMPAELLLGQLKGKTTDEEVKQVLHQAFVSVDKGFFESIDDYLAEKAKLVMHVPEGLNYYEASQRFPQLFKQLEDVQKEIKGGTMAVVTLIIENKLYVANVGCSRALLCQNDENGVLRVQQLTRDHNLSNEDESQRLLRLGLDVENLQKVGKLGDHYTTRSIGDHSVKSGYKDIEILSKSNSDPVIAVPEVNGGVEIDDSCCFLILMSDGLYKSLEVATGTEHVNRDIASMVAREFSMQTTLTGVTQAVVDKVVRKHHDAYLVSVGQRKDMCQKRDDITLLVRNFNYPLPNSVGSPTVASSTAMTVSAGSCSPINTQSFTVNNQAFTPLSVIIPPGSNNSPTKSPPQLQVFRHDTNSHTIMSTNRSTNMSTLSSSTQRSYTTSSNDSTQSGDDALGHSRQASQKPTIPLDENGRVEAYVDFSMFFNAINDLSEEERKELETELEPRPAYETIPEERELECDGSVSEEDEVDCIQLNKFGGSVMFAKLQ